MAAQKPPEGSWTVIYVSSAGTVISANVTSAIAPWDAIMQATAGISVLQVVGVWQYNY